MNSSLHRNLAIALLLTLGLAGTAPAQDQVGIFWDEAFTQYQATTSAPFELLTGYIVILDPTSGGGILGWECEVDVNGPGTFASWQLEGQAINAQSPPRFSVGLAAPLPPAAATKVATFEMLVTEVAPVWIALKPIFFASIPGEMAYLGGDNPEQLTVMTPVTGNAVVATVNENVPIAEVDRLSIQFGIQPIGAPTTVTVRVTNVGGGVLPLDVGLDCADPGYSLTSVSGPVGVAAGQTLAIPVTFTPAVVGPAECTLLLGGLAPAVPMFGAGREAIVSWSEPSDISFGSTPVGASVDMSTSIRNTGEEPLSLDVGWLDECSGFAIVSGGGSFTLQPNRIRSVSVRFAPQSVDDFACTLTFGPGLPDAAVTGNSFTLAPDYSVNPTAVDFPITDVGSSRTQLVQITNTGSHAFMINPRLADPSLPFTIVSGALEIPLFPGVIWPILVEFAPPAEEFYATDLLLGPGLTPVPLTGTGGVAVLACDVSTDLLEFSVGGLGQSQSQTLTVSNLGNVPLDLNPILLSAEFALVPGATTVLPGGSALFQVNYEPTSLGTHTAELVLGPAACTTVALSGRVDLGFEPDENLVGFFFDSNFTAFETGVAGGSVSIPVYLALINPSEPSGIAGWECRVATTGGSSFTGWDLAGNAINAANPNDPNEFTVGIGLEPLPYAAEGVLLATFQFLVYDPDPNNVTLELHPKRNPSVPDLMSWVPWSDITQLTPMLPFTGQPTVAWINTGVPVGLDTPTPLVLMQDGQVELEWPMQAAEGDGYHVYRRDPDGLEMRLTDRPLPATTAIIRYSDRPDYPGGTVLNYSYAVVQAGIELARSPEVQVTLKALPRLATGLLANVPNPFNPETRVRFRLAQAGPARVMIYDMTGRLIRTLVDEQHGAGEHGVVWQGRDSGGRPVSSGAYYVRLETDSQVDHRKIMLLK